MAIALVRPDGEGERAVTDGAHYDVMPAWSPDGRIAFVSDRSHALELWTVNADGSDLALLTNDREGDLDPAWSPDGTKLAFAGGPIRGNPEIWAMNRDGTGRQRLTTDAGKPALDFGPAWSPDGRRIAWLSERTGAWEIWRMNADGTDQAQLTRDGPASGCAVGRCMLPPYNPAWSPDGKRIAFVREVDGVPRIFVMNGDGSGARAVTEEEAMNLDWQPAVDLAVALRARPARPPAGHPFTVSVSVRNASALTATGVTVTGSVRGRAAVHSVRVTGGSCRGTKAFACRLGEVRGGRAVVLLVRASARGAGTAVFSAAAVSQQAEAVGADNRASARVRIRMR